MAAAGRPPAGAVERRRSCGAAAHPGDSATTARPPPPPVCVRMNMGRSVIEADGCRAPKKMHCIVQGSKIEPNQPCPPASFGVQYRECGRSPRDIGSQHNAVSAVLFVISFFFASTHTHTVVHTCSIGAEMHDDRKIPHPYEMRRSQFSWPQFRMLPDF